MSLPEIRLVIARAASADAGRIAIAGQLHSAGAAAAAGSSKAGSILGALLQELHDIHVPPPPKPASQASAALERDFAAAFGSLGIPSAN